ncbi:MAG: hypothetical protein AAF740_05150, partial [Bacteroidota bacterium]
VELEVPLKYNNARLLLAPVVYSGRTEAYTDSRNTELRDAIRQGDNTSNLFNHDLVRGFGMEFGIKRVLNEPEKYKYVYKAPLYWGVLVGVHYVTLEYEDAAWTPIEEDGINFLEPQLATFKDQILRLDVGPIIGGKTYTDNFHVDYFIGASYRFAGNLGETKERREHNDLNVLGHAYRGFLIRGGITFNVHLVRAD